MNLDQNHHRKIQIYSSTHIYVDYLDIFSPVIIPIGCGTNKFPPQWKTSNTGININHKHLSYSDLVSQFWVWQNIIKKKLDDSNWIGFCQYRRFWFKDFGYFMNHISHFSMNLINSYLLGNFCRKIVQFFHLKEPPIFWDQYESILSKEVNLNDYSHYNYFKTEKFFSIKNHFLTCHSHKDPDLLNRIIEKLNPSVKYDFFEYISNNSLLSPHGMFISKPRLIDNYFEVAFNWYQSCENIIRKDENISLLQSPRFFQWLNERFCDFWFKKYTNYTTQLVVLDIPKFVS